MKALDAGRLLGESVQLLDATGLICFHRRQCPHCLVQRHGAHKGVRYRWQVEKEGFNRQKNSGLNLEHVYSIDPENWKVYYLLLQIAFILTQLWERGSLLRRLALECGRPLGKLFGSLRNVARRLLDSIRYVAWPEWWFDAALARKLRIVLDSS